MFIKFNHHGNERVEKFNGYKINSYFDEKTHIQMYEIAIKVDKEIIIVSKGDKVYIENKSNFIDDCINSKNGLCYMNSI